MVNYKIKNLFSYATKELSQDAFLRWIFENWNCNQKDVRKASRTLLRKLIGLSEEAIVRISKLETRTQEKGIDILIDCKINEISYIIAIEDKTYSWTHNNQLRRYKKHIKDNYSDYEHIFIFYKTDLLSESENIFIKERDWVIFDITKIQNVFCDLKSKITNNILRDYINHVNNLYIELTGVLSNDISQWKRNHWKNFCINHHLEIPDEVMFHFGSFQNKYIYLQFFYKSRINKYPYLEIQSKEFINKNNHFSFRFLLHGINKELIEEYAERWKEKINKSKLFKSQNHPKQIGKNINMEKITSVKHLERVIKTYVLEYREAMQ